MISKRGGFLRSLGSVLSALQLCGRGGGGGRPAVTGCWEGGWVRPGGGPKPQCSLARVAPLPLPHRRVGDGLKASGGAWAFSCLPHGPCGGCRRRFPDAGTGQRRGRPALGPRDGHDNGDGGAPAREAGSAEPQLVAAGPWGRPGRREVARRVALAQASRRCAQGRSQSRSGGQPCIEVGGEASSEAGPSAEAGTGDRHHRGCVRSDPRAALRGWPFSGPDGVRRSSLGALSGDCRHRLGP